MSSFQPDAVRLGADYEAAREDSRTALATAKSARRIQLDDRLALVFENAATVHAAAEESLRTERVSAADAVAEHLEAFAAAAPGSGRVTAVLFVDSDDPAGLAESAAALRGVQRFISLVAGGAQVRGVPQELGDEAPAYHLTFAIPDEVRRNLLGGADVAVAVSLPGLETSVSLSSEQRAALLEDLLTRLGAGCASALLAGLLAACGAAPVSVEPSWRAAHPDPQSMSFDENAPGVCQLTPQYPDEAPAAIEYLGNVYVQTGKSPQPAHPPGSVLTTSGSWSVRAQDGSELFICTGSAMYEYSLENTC